MISTAANTEGLTLDNTLGASNLFQAEAVQELNVRIAQLRPAPGWTPRPARGGGKQCRSLAI